MSLEQLKNRARMLQRAREFFYERGVVEVDCNALVQRAPLDRNIDVLQVAGSGFLHTSPEYAMKKLLAKGSGDIFFLGHVFRKEELGPLHNPEFTMAEWYRIGFSLDEMIAETVAFLSLFLGALPVKHVGYHEAFLEYAGVDIDGDLTRHLPQEASQWPRLTQLDYLISHRIQPLLGRGELTVLRDYPPDQAALACTIAKGGRCVAERFEIYYEGIELTNGYHELKDVEELKQRFALENGRRQAQGFEPFALDEALLGALEQGLPDCSGVAVGFDRALMLQENAPSIHDVLV